MFNIQNFIKEITESITGIKDKLLENLPGEAKMHNAFDRLREKAATLRERYHLDGHGAHGADDLPGQAPETPSVESPSPLVREPVSMTRR